MKTLYLLAGLAAFGLPTLAQAQSIETSSEIGVNIASSGGGAIETTANIATELSFGGLFVGGEMETLYQDPTDKAEITLTLGYSYDLGNDFALTASYARIFKDQSGFASHEIAASLDFPVSNLLSGTFEVVHDLKAVSTDVSLAAEFGLGGNFTGEALLGHNGTAVYGELGVSYDITDNISSNVLIELAANKTPVYNLGVTFNF